MEKIRIKDLKLHIIIGINDDERVNKQDVLINAEIHFDGKKARQSDSIEDTFNYKTITKRIIQEVEKTEFFLLEKLCDHVLELIMEDPIVQFARVEIDKPGALRFARSVSIEVEAAR